LEESPIAQLPTSEVEELYQVRIGFFSPNNEWHVQLHSVPDNKTVTFVSHNLGTVLGRLTKAVVKHQAELESELAKTKSNLIVIPNGALDV
jgi:hypothetical protein